MSNKNPAFQYNKIPNGGLSRRKLLVGAALVSASCEWSKPLVNAVILPAHAETSSLLCDTDTTVGGPLVGNASGADNCQSACEAEAADQSAELCLVTESVDASNAVQCECELDLP